MIPAGRADLLRNQFIHVIGDAMELLRPDDEIDMRQILEQGFAARLSHAAKETKHHMWPLFRHATEHSHFPKRLLVSHVAHAAGI